MPCCLRGNRIITEELFIVVSSFPKDIHCPSSTTFSNLEYNEFSYTHSDGTQNFLRFHIVICSIRFPICMIRYAEIQRYDERHGCYYINIVFKIYRLHLTMVPNKFSSKVNLTFVFSCSGKFESAYIHRH